MDEPEYDPENDPVLKALNAAPWAQISEEERAEIEDLARNIGPTISAAEFMAFVETLRHEQENVEGQVQ